MVQDWGGPLGLGLLDAAPGLARRVVAANTVLHTADPALAGRLEWACHADADGTVTVEQMLLDYQRLTQELTPFRPSLFVQGATVSDVPDAVLAAYDAPFPDESFCAGPRQLPLLMGLTPASACAGLNRRTMRDAGRIRRPVPHCVLRRGSRHRAGWAEVLQASRARRGRAGARHHGGRRAFPPGGLRARAGRRRGELVREHARRLTTRPAVGLLRRGLGAAWLRAAAMRVGLRRSAGAELRLEGGQLVVDLRVLADLVELLLDVVGAAADVLEHAGLEQLVEGTRAGLHGGDLVLGPLQRRAGVVEGLRDAGRALVDLRDRPWPRCTAP